MSKSIYNSQKLIIDESQPWTTIAITPNMPIKNDELSFAVLEGWPVEITFCVDDLTKIKSVYVKTPRNDRLLEGKIDIHNNFISCVTGIIRGWTHDRNHNVMDTFTVIFKMPDEPAFVTMDLREEEKTNMESIVMPNHSHINTKGIETQFEIPEPMAKRLSELLVTQSIREKLLGENIDNPDRFKTLEKMLIPVITEIESIKNTITNEYVPEGYQSEDYMWNYDGYEVDGCTVSILKA